MEGKRKGKREEKQEAKRGSEKNKEVEAARSNRAAIVKSRMERRRKGEPTWLE